MSYSFLQLNIEKDKHLDVIIPFLHRHNFDLIHMQETDAGKMTDRNINCITVLLQALPEYDCVSASDFCITGDENSFSAKSTFYKKEFRLLSRRVIRMKEYQTVDDFMKFDWTQIPRSALLLQLDMRGKQLISVNTHLAWGPTPEDAPYKVNQARLLAAELKKLPAPFLISGDFNVTPDTETVRQFADIGRNLTAEHHIQNTLNPDLHRAKHLFPPGLAVDYIITDNKMHISGFSVIETESVSDHLALTAEFTLS